MKMMMIAYNEAVDDDVMDLLAKCGLNNYTKLISVYGKGNTSGTHKGDDIWPGLNNVLFVACEDAHAKEVVSHVREMRKGLGREGVKAFVWGMEEVT